MGNTPTVDEHEKLLEDFNYSPKGIRDFKESLKDFRTAFVLREVECTQPMKVLVGQAHQLELFFSNLIYVIFHRKPSKTTGKGSEKLIMEQQFLIDILRSDNMTLEKKLRKLKENQEACVKNVAVYEKLIRKLRKEKEDILTKCNMELEEFEEKMALLEPQLEMNGNITKRHLQIADEFETLCGIFWSSAKLVMDKHLTDAEEKNIEILRVIMLEMEKLAKERHAETTQDIFENVFECDENGSKRWVNTDQEGHELEGKWAFHNLVVEKKKVEIPDDLKVTICDFLRVTTDKGQTGEFIEDLFWRLKERLKTEEKFDHLYSAFLAIPLKERKTVLVFMKHLASLCWKMATQQEQMSFDVDTGLGEKWMGEDYQDVSLQSEDPKDPEMVVKYYELPALIHEKKPLRPGRVFIDKKD